jgi:hypothetical protein
MIPNCGAHIFIGFNNDNLVVISESAEGLALQLSEVSIAFNFLIFMQ